MPDIINLDDVPAFQLCNRSCFMDEIFDLAWVGGEPFLKNFDCNGSIQGNLLR